ncbi:MAG: SixA phosphatase family protein, partial [Methylococcaceae bacterium]
MSRELWLFRHGKSDRNLAMDDFDRPLKKRGKRGVQRIGEWLNQQRLIADWIVSSPAKRAVTTAKIVQKAIAVEGVRI